MRQVLRGLAIVLLVSPAASAGAQQGAIQVSAAAQGIAGDPGRRFGEPAFVPDFGVSWVQPGSRFGTFQLDLRGTSRSGLPHLGRTFEAGDTYMMPAIGEYRFSNLFTPAVTFTGAAVSARSNATTLSMVAGRTTALRNIFGTDPDALDQTLVTGRATRRIRPQLELQGRASYIRTRDLKEFSYSIASSRQAGGGARLTLTPAIHLVGDGSIVTYQRVGATDTTTDASFLAGTSWLLARGWVQVNASRFSPGEFPAVQYQLQDREGVFAAGEYDVFSRLRVFGGIDAFRSNLTPAASATSARPLAGTNGTRRFGGVRFQILSRSALTVRLEDGARIARPIRPGLGAPSESDTGSWSAEWQSIFGSTTTFTRYSRRENVDRTNAVGSYTQHDASGQVFHTVSRGLQLFGLVVLTQSEMADGGGNTYWQAGGGAQAQIPRRSLWMRAEGTFSRNVDLLTDRLVPREALSLGLSGQVAKQTTIGVDVSIDRAPAPGLEGSPWLTRSMLRVTHTISTGTARVATGATGATSVATRSRGTGSILGVAFADWNGNGVQDADENLLEGIPVRIPGLTTVTTATNGQFSFLNVPAGVQDVGLDTTALPLDFDPPAQASVQVDLSRGSTERVAFGLVPLGSITGRVVRDVNGNGGVDADEEAIDGAIVVLDNGLRSEQTRRGRFRFDSVRSGDHTVQLLLESIGEGARATTPTTVATPLTRDKTTVDVAFLVTIEKRPEIRRVFPSRSGAATPTPAPAAAAPQKPRTSAAPSAPATTPARPARPATVPSSQYVVQVAALRDRVRARELTASLTAAGYAAYIVKPAVHDGPFRVRVGGFATRAEAERVKVRLEKERGEKLWIVREGADSAAAVTVR